MNFDYIQVAGHMTRDPKFIEREDFNMAFTAVAVNKIKGGNKIVQYYDLAFYGKNADTINKYARKGTGLYVRGTPEGRTFTDKSGVERPSWSIRVDRFHFFGKGGATPNELGEPVEDNPVAEGEPVAKDEVVQDEYPF